MNEDISVLPKTLRKIMMTGNTLEPTRTGYVLTNLNRFISFERVSSIHKRTRKKTTGNSEGNDATVERKFNNLCIVPGMQYPKTAIRQWEESLPSLLKMIDEGKNQEVLDALITAKRIENTCHKTIVLCLIILIKKSKDQNFISNCFGAVPAICHNSALFMLFVEIWKLYAAKDKSSGWGKRMKKVVHQWYKQWDPHQLALEVTRCPSSYTWSHKDLIRLAHVNLEKLPMDTRIVLNYAFSGYQKTYEKFNSQDGTIELLNLLKDLNWNQMKGDVDPLIAIKRAQFIMNKFGAISLNDFPSHILTDCKVLNFLLEQADPNVILSLVGTRSVIRMIYQSNTLTSLFASKFKEGNFYDKMDVMLALEVYNICRRTYSEYHKDRPNELKIWFKNVVPSTEKLSIVRNPHKWTKQHEEFFKSFDYAISAKTKNMKIDGSFLVFVDVRPAIDNFISISLDDPISKEIRATQAIAMIIRALSTNNLDALAPDLLNTLKKKEPCPDPYPMYSIHSDLCDKAKDEGAPLVIDDCFDVCLKKKVSACVFLYYEVTAELLAEIHGKFLEIKKKPEAKKLKLVVVELKLTVGSPLVSSLHHPDLLFLFSFNRALLPTIEAFVQEKL